MLPMAAGDASEYSSITTLAAGSETSYVKMSKPFKIVMLQCRKWPCHLSLSPTDVCKSSGQLIAQHIRVADTNADTHTSWIVLILTTVQTQIEDHPQRDDSFEKRSDLSQFHRSLPPKWFITDSHLPFWSPKKICFEGRPLPFNDIRWGLRMLFAISSSSSSTVSKTRQRISASSQYAFSGDDNNINSELMDIDPALLSFKPPWWMWPCRALTHCP